MAGATGTTERIPMRKVLLAGAASLSAVRLLLMAAVLVAAVAWLSAGSAAAGRARAARQVVFYADAATACSNETVPVFGKPTTLRFALHGVSCSQAHSLIRMYFRTATIQSCRGHGNACILDFPGGWACSFLIVTEGPGYAGCAKSQSERFKVFRVTRQREVEFYWAAGACAMGPGAIAPGRPTQPDRVLCQSAADVVSLLPSGRVNVCTGGMTNLKCLWGNAGEHTRKLAPGEQRTVGPFRCSSARASITCVVIKTGIGFVLTASSATKVG